MLADGSRLGGWHRPPDLRWEVVVLESPVTPIDRTPSNPWKPPSSGWKWAQCLEEEPGSSSRDSCCETLCDTYGMMHPGFDVGACVEGCKGAPTPVPVCAPVCPIVPFGAPYPIPLPVVD